MATSLKNINTLIKNIRDLTPEMQLGAEKVLIPQIEDLWDEGRGANGKKMKRLSAKYKARKEKLGRRGIPDMLLHGNMRDALTTDKAGKNIVDILFGSVRQREKASGNAAKRPGFMKLSGNKTLLRTYRRWLLKKMLGKI